MGIYIYWEDLLRHNPLKLTKQTSVVHIRVEMVCVEGCLIPIFDRTHLIFEVVAQQFEMIHLF